MHRSVPFSFSSDNFDSWELFRFLNIRGNASRYPDLREPRAQSWHVHFKFLAFVPDPLRSNVRSTLAILFWTATDSRIGRREARMKGGTIRGTLVPRIDSWTYILILAVLQCVWCCCLRYILLGFSFHTFIALSQRIDIESDDWSIEKAKYLA